MLSPGPGRVSWHSAVVIDHMRLRQPNSSPSSACTPRNPSVPFVSSAREMSPVRKSSFTARRVPAWSV